MALMFVSLVWMIHGTDITYHNTKLLIIYKGQA